MNGELGLFISEDPIGFGGGLTNLSSYLGGAPYDYTDPIGNGFLNKIVKLFKTIRREVSRVVNQIADVVSEAIDDVGDFLEGTWEGGSEFATPATSSGNDRQAEENSVNCDNNAIHVRYAFPAQRPEGCFAERVPDTHFAFIA